MAIEITKLDYPIAKDNTTVQNIFNNLKVISGYELRTAVARGKVCIDGVPCNSVRDRLTDGQVLTYNDFEITVGVDNGLKTQRLLTEMMKSSGGFRGNTSGSTFGSGYTRR